MEANKKDYDERMNKLTQYLTVIIASMMDHINTFKLSPEKKNPLKDQDTNTMVLANKKASLLDRGHSTKSGGMWTLKHETSSPKFYEIFIKT